MPAQRIIQATGIKGLFSRDGVYYYRAPKNKDQPKGTPQAKAVNLHTRDFTAAVARMTENQVAVDSEFAMKADTMEVVLPLYYAAKGDDAKATRRARKVVLDSFMRMNCNPRVDLITERMIDEWRLELATKGGGSGSFVKAVDPSRSRWQRKIVSNGGGKKQPVSQATLRSYTITLRAFLKWCLKKKLIRVHPLPEMTRSLRVVKTRVEGFHTVEERDRLIAEAAKSPPHVRLLLLLGYVLGMREGETLALNKKWLWIADDWSRGTLTVQETPIRLRDGKTGLWKPKWGKQRTLRLPKSVLDHFHEHGIDEPFVIKPENELWPDESMNAKRYDSKKALAGLAKRVGVTHLTSHMMRHSCATHLSMLGVPMGQIAGILGDSVVVIEKHYAGFAPAKDNPLDLLMG